MLLHTRVRRQTAPVAECAVILELTPPRHSLRIVGSRSLMLPCFACLLMFFFFFCCLPLLQVTGRTAELAMSHTASRVIQACAKHGGDEVRSSRAPPLEISLDLMTRKIVAMADVV